MTNQNDTYKLSNESIILKHSLKLQRLNLLLLRAERLFLFFTGKHLTLANYLFKVCHME